MKASEGSRTWDGTDRCLSGWRSRCLVDLLLLHSSPQGWDRTVHSRMAPDPAKNRSSLFGLLATSFKMPSSHPGADRDVDECGLGSSQLQFTRLQECTWACSRAFSRVSVSAPMQTNERTTKSMTNLSTADLRGPKPRAVVGWYRVSVSVLSRGWDDSCCFVFGVFEPPVCGPLGRCLFGCKVQKLVKNWQVESLHISASRTW